MKLDPVIARIRKARHAISESVGHNPHRLVQHYMNLQRRHADRLLHEDEREMSGEGTIATGSKTPGPA